jgi:putative transcriptional regulator
MKIEKRNLFTEMMSGMDEMKAQRKGKITLRQYAVEIKPVTEVEPEKDCDLTKGHNNPDERAWKQPKR